MSDLESSNFFNFAGHGRSDSANTYGSCQLLDDWKTTPLIVGNLRKIKLQDNTPFLAYLSAYSTGICKDARLSNERIHLVSSFQLSGFRHVVGTLWEISDKQCVEIARTFDNTLREEGKTDLAVCCDPHRALKKLRDKSKASCKAPRDAKLVSPGTRAPSPENVH